MKQLARILVLIPLVFAACTTAYEARAKRAAASPVPPKSGYDKWFEAMAAKGAAGGNPPPIGKQPNWQLPYGPFTAPL